MRDEAQACRQAQDRAGVLGNIGLVKRDLHWPHSHAGQARAGRRGAIDFLMLSLGIGAMAHLRSPVKGANRTRWVVPLGLLSPGWKAAGLPANCRVGAPWGREGS